jgi:hypothetical protein
MAVAPLNHRQHELVVMLIVQCTQPPYLRFRPSGDSNADPFWTNGPDTPRYSARPPVEEMMTMKKLILAAFAALSLTAGVAPMAHALVYSNHSGPYNNTGNGPSESGLEGGGG